MPKYTKKYTTHTHTHTIQGQRQQYNNNPASNNNSSGNSARRLEKGVRWSVYDCFARYLVVAFAVAAAAHDASCSPRRPMRCQQRSQRMPVAVRSICTVRERVWESAGRQTNRQSHASSVFRTHVCVCAYTHSHIYLDTRARFFCYLP